MIPTEIVAIFGFIGFILLGFGSSLVDKKRLSVTRWQRFIAIVFLTISLVIALPITFDALYHLFFGGYENPISNIDIRKYSNSRTGAFLVPILVIFFRNYPWLGAFIFAFVSLSSLYEINHQIKFFTNKKVFEEDRKRREKIKELKNIKKALKEEALNKEPEFLSDVTKEGWLIDKENIWYKRYFHKDNKKEFIVEQTGKLIPNEAPYIKKELLLTFKEAKSDWKYYLDDDWLPTNKKWD